MYRLMVWSGIIVRMAIGGIWSLHFRYMAPSIRNELSGWSWNWREAQTRGIAGYAHRGGMCLPNRCLKHQQLYSFCWLKALQASRFARKCKTFRIHWDSWSFWSFNFGFEHVSKQTKKIKWNETPKMPQASHRTEDSSRAAQRCSHMGVLTLIDKELNCCWDIRICFSSCLIGWCTVNKLDILDITSGLHCGVLPTKAQSPPELLHVHSGIPLLSLLLLGWGTSQCIHTNNAIDYFWIPWEGCCCLFNTVGLKLDPWL